MRYSSATILAMLVVSWATTSAAQQQKDAPNRQTPGLEAYEPHLGRDLLDTGSQAGKGLLVQWTDPEILGLAAGSAGVIALLWLDEERQQDAIQDANVFGSTFQKTGDIAGLAFNIPLVHAGFYITGRASEQPRLTRFAVELSATQLIVGLEVFAISQIPFHDRPIFTKNEEVKESNGFINDTLRGTSSFPSGHMTGVATLAFKGWEWFGWQVGAPATAATVIIGYARVEEGQHYITDVVGSVLLAGLASLATSRARDLWTEQAFDANGKDDAVTIIPAFSPDGQLVLLGLF